MMAEHMEGYLPILFRKSLLLMVAVLVRLLRVMTRMWVNCGELVIFVEVVLLCH